MTIKIVAKSKGGSGMLVREKFLQLGKGESGFAVDPIKAIMGLPAEISQNILWNLWDIGCKYGEIVGGEDLRFNHESLFIEICNKGISGSTCLIIKDSKGMLLKPEYIFELWNGLQVRWQKNITCQQVLHIIEDVNITAVQCGLMSFRGGERSIVPDYARMTR